MVGSWIPEPKRERKGGVKSQPSIYNSTPCFSLCRVSLPSANLAMSCKRPPADPRSRSWSPSGKVMSVPPSGLSVTWPTLIGRPASSKPFNCSRARRAHSESENYKKPRPLSVTSRPEICPQSPTNTPSPTTQETCMGAAAQIFLSQGM